MHTFSKLKVLVIGAGSIGQRHAFNLNKLGVKNVAIYDTDPLKAKQLAGKYGTHHYYDLDSAASFKPDCSFVCTYPSTHLELANFCLDVNSHVFIEKPIATTTSGIQSMLRKAERKKLKISVGYNMRFDKGLNYLKKKVQSKYCPLAISSQWGHNLKLWRPGLNYKNHYLLQKENSLILDDSHEYDYLRWLLEDEASSVYCQTQKIPSLKKSEGIASMTIKFRKGTVANLFIDMLRPKYERMCHVLSDHGDIRWQFIPSKIAWKNYDSKAHSIVTENLLNSKLLVQQKFEVVTNQMYVDEIRNFLSAIVSDTNSFVDGWEGLKTLKIGLAAIESASKNKVVSL
ncbi:MAG: Gfo/Idh/MocA family oxidoreductase [Candidatus Nitrosotenuis sp.]